jgi:hypothetical protein
MMMTETTQCSNSPAAGELNGRLLAKNLEKGRTPSRPSSWTTMYGQRELTTNSAV